MKKVTRSFIETTAVINGESKFYPNMTKSQVEGFLGATGLKADSITSELVRYECSEEEFLSVSKKVEVKAKEER